MTGFEVYRYYLGIRLHFSARDYDVVAAGGRTNVGQSAYMKRKDRKLFERLAERLVEPRAVIKYLIANFAYGHNDFLYDRDTSDDFLAQWVKTKESLSRVFANDLDVILNYAEKNHLSLALMFSAHKDGLGTILKLLKSRLINVESACLIHQMCPGLLDMWEDFAENKLMHEDDILRIRKLTSFVIMTPMCNTVWKKFEEENLS